MIPVSTLCDEYIDRRKLSEKNPFEYIVPPPQVGRNKYMNANEDGTNEDKAQVDTSRQQYTFKRVPNKVIDSVSWRFSYASDQKIKRFRETHEKFICS